MTGPRYAELQVTSHFSFLRGASSCDELFGQAAALGIEALAVVDRNSLAGIVRAHEAAKATGVRLVVGCRLDLTDGMSGRLFAALPSAVARQRPSRQGEVPSRMGGSRHLRRRSARGVGARSRR